MIPPAEKLGFAVALVIASLSAFSLFVELIASMNSAFGDGLTQEELTGSLGNRKADLLIKMVPAVGLRKPWIMAKNQLSNSDCLIRIQINHLVMLHITLF